MATVVDFPHLWVSLTMNDTSLCVPNDIPDELLSIH